MVFALLFCLAMPAQQSKTRRANTTTQKKTQQKTTAAKKTKQQKTATTKQQSRKTTTKKSSTQQKGNTTKKTHKQPETIKGLQNERKTLQANKAVNMRKQEELKRNVKAGVENLMILDHEIQHKQKVVDTIRHDITKLNLHIGLLDKQLDMLNDELAERRNRYMQSMRYMHRNRSVQNQLMFIFSADNFNQMYRRLRFTQEYAAYQKAQGEAVKSKQKQVEEKKLELAQSKNKKDTLLTRGEHEKKLLEGKQTEQKAQVDKLKKQQKTVEALILEQQRREAELNARIDQLIAEEIARERARQEAEARRKAAAEAAKKRAEEEQRQKELAKKSKSSKSSKKSKKGNSAEPSTTVSSTTEVAAAEPTVKKPKVEDFTMPAEDRQMTGGFESNRGRLPLPITGAYRLVRGFGTYSPEGLRHVTLQSNGWHLKGQPGAKAQSIFDGVVSGVYLQGGSYIVTVRHGRYISAYINLASVSVRKGQQIKARSVIGSLGSDNTMQFQLRNWNTLLNPSHWLGR